MTETAVQATAAATPVKTPKTKKVAVPKAKGGAKKAAPTHPPTSQMVNSAIKSLKERGGSSLQAIKKYIASTYKVDAEKVAPFIKKYLKSAVDGGTLIRTKGKGASGSFKLASAAKTENTNKPVVKKPKAPKKAAKPKKEKSTPKKAKAAPKPKTAKPKSVVKKSPSKVKKTTKAPAAKKPKSPKPKKTTPKKVAVKKPAKK